MAWSDEARRAALEARRLHAQRQGTLYHGGPPMRGMYIKANSRAYATAELSVARSYQNRAHDPRAGVYVVERPYVPKDVVASRKTRGYAVKQRQAHLRSFAFAKEIKVYGQRGIESPHNLRWSRRLPQGKGRAARGHY